MGGRKSQNPGTENPDTVRINYWLQHWKKTKERVELSGTYGYTRAAASV